MMTISRHLGMGKVATRWGTCTPAPLVGCGHSHHQSLWLRLPHHYHTGCRPNDQYFSQTLITAALAVNNITTDQLHDSCLRIMGGWCVRPLPPFYL